MKKSTITTTLITAFLAILSVMPIYFGVLIGGRYAREDISPYNQLVFVIWLVFFLCLFGIKKLGFQISTEYFRTSILVVFFILILGTLKFQKDLEKYEKRQLERQEIIIE